MKKQSLFFVLGIVLIGTVLRSPLLLFQLF